MNNISDSKTISEMLCNANEIQIYECKAYNDQPCLKQDEIFEFTRSFSDKIESIHLEILKSSRISQNNASSSSIAAAVSAIAAVIVTVISIINLLTMSNY